MAMVAVPPIPKIAGRENSASLAEIQAWVEHPYASFNPVVHAVLRRLLLEIALATQARESAER